MRKIISFSIVFILTMGTVFAGAETFTNSFYAIESYSERHYTQYTEQVSIGWGEIEKNNGVIEYTNQGSTYRLPGSGGEALLSTLKSQGNTLMKSVFLEDTKIFKEILDSPGIQARLIEEIIGDKTLHPNSDIQYDGIMIDFESLKDRMDGKSGYRDAFTNFMKDLREELPADKSLSIAVHPIRQSGIGYFDGYDYKALGNLADELLIMGHDYHQGTKDQSQPIKASAPYKLVEESIEKAIEKGVAPEKLVLGLSLNPVQWREQDSGYQVFSPRYEVMLRAIEGKSAGQEIIEVTPANKRFDENLKVGYTYLERRNTSTGQVTKDHFYYENPKSIELKKELADKYNLKGLSIWRLGIGSSETLDSIYQQEMFDLQGNGRITRGDLDLLFDQIGKRSGNSGWNRKLDYNGDGVIDALDIARMARFVGGDKASLLMTEKPSNSPGITVKYPRTVKAGEEYILSVELQNVSNLFTVGITLEDHHEFFEAKDGAMNFNNPLKDTDHWTGEKKQGTGLKYSQSLLSNPQVLHTEKTSYRIPVTAKKSGTVSGSNLGVYVQLVDRYGGEIELGSAIKHQAVNPMSNPVRVSGTSRYATAVSIAKEAYPDGVDSVIIARGDSVDGNPQIVDALAASVLAGSIDAPILLTQTSQIPTATKEGIKNLGAKTIYIMGGPSVVEEQMFRDLGLEVQRISGPSRYETAVEISNAAQVSTNQGLIVQGNALADALAVGSVAHKQGMPILLVGENHVPDATKNQIEKLGLESLYVIGGEGVISKEVMNELQGMSGVSAKRISGRSRYETGVAVAKEFWSEDTVVLANGVSMVDSVSAAALEKPLLFVGNRGLNDQVKNYLSGKSKLYITGGETVIPGWLVDESILAAE